VPIYRKKVGMRHLLEFESFVNETIVRRRRKFCVLAKSGKNMGCRTTKKAAVKRLRQVEYFKKHS